MEELDKGWGWLVVFAACLINFIMAGLGRIAGILYIVFIDVFHVDRKGASAPFSVRAATRYLLGPVVGIFGQKYGVRAVTIFGGIIGTISAAGCFFAKDIVWVTVLWGGMNGLATTFTVTLPQIVIAQYFKKDIATASGIVFSSTCMGAFLFPVFLERLILHYGLNGTFLIIAAIIMHVIPAALTLKTPQRLENKSKHMKRLSVEEDAIASVCISHKVEDCSLHIKDNINLANENITCTPRIQFSDIIVNRKSKCLENYIDLSYLRKNKEMVLQLLAMNTSLPDFSEQENQTTLRPPEERFLREDRESLGCSCEVLQNKYNIFLDLVNFINEDLLTYLKLTSEDGKSSPCEKDHSLKIFSETDKAEKFSIHETHFDTDISDVYKKLSKSYFFLKLQEIQGYSENQIISFFSHYDRFEVLKLITEFRRIYALCNKLMCFEPVEETTATIFIEELKEVKNNMINIQEQNIDKPLNSFWIHIKAAFQLHSDQFFLLICLCRIVYFITVISFITIIVDFAIDQGLLEKDGKYAIIAFSVGDFIGRLCLGWITDRNYMSLDKYMMLIMILQGVCTVFLPLMRTWYTLLPTLVIFGLFMGSEFVQHPVLISKYISNNKQSIAMGCSDFFPGFIGFGLPSYIGYFRDTIGAYDWIFYINGALAIATGLLWMLKPYFARHSPPGISKESNSSEFV